MTSNNSSSKYLELIAFRVGNLSCALPISEIQEIIDLPSITRVPMPQPEIEGLVNLRGSIVTIIDMRVRCGFEPLPRDRHSRIIATELQGELMGLMVEEVEDSISAPLSEIIATPGNIKGIEAEIFRAVYKKDDKLIGILGLESTLLGAAA